MKLSPEFAQQVREFLAPRETLGRRAEWINCTELQCYMRRGQRTFQRLPENPSVSIHTIEIANITVHPKYQGQGCYAALLDLFDEVAGDRAVYVENVHFPEQYPLYLKRGFTPIYLKESPDFPASFFKLPKESK